MTRSIINWLYQIIKCLWTVVEWYEGWFNNWQLGKPAIIGMRSLDQILVHISYYTHFTILGCTANLSLDPPFRSSLHPSLLSRESSSAVRSSFISLSVLDLSPKTQRGAAVFFIFSNAGLPTLDRRRVGRLPMEITQEMGGCCATSDC